MPTIGFNLETITVKGMTLSVWVSFVYLFLFVYILYCPLSNPSEFFFSRISVVKRRSGHTGGATTTTPPPSSLSSTRPTSSDWARPRRS